MPGPGGAWPWGGLAVSLSSSLCVFPHLHDSLVIFFSPVSQLPGVLDLAVSKVSISVVLPKELCWDSTQEKPNLGLFPGFHLVSGKLI